MDRDTTTLRGDLDRSADRFFDSSPGIFFTLRLDRKGGLFIPFLRGDRSLFPSLSPESVATTIEPLLHLCHPEDRDPFLNELHASARENRLCCVELRTEDRNDRPAVIELTAHPKPDPDDPGVMEWHGVMQDITERHQVKERKRLEEALAKREREFHSLADNLPVAVIRYDTEQRRQYVNPAAARMLHGITDQMLGLLPGEGGVPALPPMIEHYRSRMSEVLSSGEPCELEFVLDALPAELQKHYAVRFAAEYSEDEHISGVLSIWFDITERKKTLERLEQAQRIAQLGSWDWDVVTNRVEWSEMAYEIYTPDGRPDDPGFEEFKQSLHPDDLERVVAAVTSAFENDTPFDLEHRVVSESRGVRIVHAQGRVFQNAEGQPIRMVGTVHDITERKRMEADLSDARRFLDKVIDSITDPIFVKDEEYNLVMMNEAFCSMIGQPREVLQGRSDHDFLPREQVRVFREYEERALKLGEASVNEEVVTAGDGSTRYLQTRKDPFIFDNGRRYLVASIRDITERKRMEIEIAVREQEFRSLAESSPDFIVRYDIEGRHCYLNNLLIRLLGLSSQDEMLGKRPSEVWPDGRFAVIEQATEQAVAKGEMVSVELSSPREDGELMYSSIYVVPEHDSDGQIIGSIAFGRDITQLKRMEEKLQERQAFLHSLLNAIPVPVFYKDREGRYLGFNRAYEEFFGAKKEDLLGKSVFDISPEDLSRTYHAKDSELFVQGGIQRYESRVRSASGSMHDVMFHKSIFENPTTGEASGLIGAVLDITDRKRGESELRNRFDEIVRLNDELEDLTRSLEEQTVELEASEESLKQTEAWYRGILHSAPDGMMVINRKGVITQVNVELLRMFGYSEEELIGEKMELLVSPAKRELHVSRRERFADATDPGGAAQLVSNLLACHKDGSEFYVDVTVSVLPDTEWSSGSICASIRDVTERRKAEELLSAREHEFRTLVENSTDTVARYGKDLQRLYANPAFASLVEGGIGALIGKRPSEVPGGPFASHYEEKLIEVLESGEECDFELPWTDMAGKEICSLISMTPEFNAEGEIISVLAVGRDISELHAIRKEIHQMAFFDPLTDLPNRSLFNDRIRQMLADAAHHHYMVGVMMIDMDRFKVINDTMGHAMGDELLRETGARLSGCVRTYDTVARLGGDEFAVILPDIRHADDLGRIANKMRSVFDDPFFLNGKEVFVSCSIGIALYPDDSKDPDDLLKFADSAMYVSKRTGRNTFRFYSKEMTEVANERLMLESELRRAMDRDELELVYQPKFDLASRQAIGSEALLRWNHHGRGMISPEKFIPIAEDSGLILELGEWVLREACRTASNLNSSNRPLHKVAINLSARQFQSNDLVGTVVRILKETECQPEWIELEITESLLLDEGSGAIDVLIAFRSIGITIAIDDFGTGYSSLNYLARYPINTLKIDRSFIFSMENDPSRAELVKAILSFASSMRQDVVAEGVETRGQADFLLAHGCQIAQGFLFSMPVPKADLIALVDSVSDS